MRQESRLLKRARNGPREETVQHTAIGTISSFSHAVKGTGSTRKGNKDVDNPYDTPITNPRLKRSTGVSFRQRACIVK